MAINKLDSGGWELNIKPGGRSGKQIRKTFKTQAEAKSAEIYFRSQHQKNPEWIPPKKDNRRLKDLIKIWWENHGQNLASGEDTKSRLNALADHIKNPPAVDFKSSNFTKYRSERLAAGLHPTTINKEHAYLKAMFSELQRIAEWTKENPVQKIRMIKVKQEELTFLNQEQIEELFESLEKAKNADAILITKICLSVGARWSEAQNLTVNQVKNGVALKGKNGKIRTIPISKNLKDEIQNHIKTKNIKTGKIFPENMYNTFREAVERAKIDLPDGQLTHALRHTFASHFIQNGGNILSLQKILDHQTLTMTIKYAHLARDHMVDAVKFNPLAKI